MRNISDILWGIVFIAVALIAALHFLDIWTFPFFDGWWTLFIIVPSLIAITKKEDRTMGAVGLIIGILLYLSSNDFIDFDIIWKIVVVIVLLAIGLSLIRGSKKRPELNPDSNEVTAIFSGSEVYYEESKEFNGCDCKAIFGGVDVDLRDVKLNSNVQINAMAIFGGIEIRVPRNVNVEVDSTGIFGGSDNHIINSPENEFTIYINSIAAFGGVEIK